MNKALVSINGFIALSTVLIISAIVLGISISVSLLGIGEGQSSLALYNGEKALQIVEGCAEDALLKLNASATYTGGNIIHPDGTCTVLVSNSGNEYTLNISTTTILYRRTLSISATRSTTIVINSWKEI